MLADSQGMTVELFGKTLGRDLIVVAEIGVNHEGDPDVASTLVRLAAESGADAVKLQSFTPTRYASASDPARLARVTGFALDESAHLRLIAEAADLGISLFSTAGSEDWVPFIAEHCPAVKVASGDLTFEPVVRAAAASGKPVLLSTGLGTLDEIDAAVCWVREEVGADRLSDHLLLFHCTVSYPTPPEQANVRVVRFLAERYGVHVGFSNHVIGPEACLAAVALGAPALEVHFTDRSQGREFRDHELSFEPAALAALIASAGTVRASLGEPDKVRAEAEVGNLASVRKGVVAARDLTAGTVLTADDLPYARPATEVEAGELPGLIGRTLGVALKAGELVPRSTLGPS
jgi:N-acetylneuraminate synthase/N,N'-diacetyllegionaminate synthase